MALVKSAGNIAQNAFFNQDVVVGGSEYLTILAVVGPTATALGDVAVQLQQYRDDKADPVTYPGSTGPSSGTTTGAGPTLAPINIPTLEAQATNVLSGGLAYAWVRYRVAGLHRVQIQVQQKNVSALPVEIDFDLG